MGKRKVEEEVGVDDAEAKRLKKEKKLAKAAKKDKKDKKEKKKSKKDKKDKGDKQEKKKSKKKDKEAKAADAAPAAAAAEPTDAAAADKASSSFGVFATFDETSFPQVLKKALNAKFPSPSPIQSAAWPVAVNGKDLVAVAKTGSGKTLGFLLPAFEACSAASTGGASAGRGASPTALVLAPTRELALQIQTECEVFGKLVGVTSACCYGGVDVNKQVQELKQCPQIVVATPGRLTDMLERKALSLQFSCTFVVLDEADRMLDMGFEPQIKKIFAALPEKRQTLFFTATWPKSVRKLAGSFLRAGEVEEIFVGTGDGGELEANKAVSQKFVQATDDEKDDKLYAMLAELKEGSRVVVFANTKRRVGHLEKAFQEFGTCAVHGDKKQNERDAALRKFVNDECPLMFATDVAARGLDIKGVTHVINYDMARDVESYVHRIGRTGRAGELGASITFWNPDYDKETAPALAKIAREAGQPVPDWLAKFENKKASKQWSLAKATLKGIDA